MAILGAEFTTRSLVYHPCRKEARLANPTLSKQFGALPESGTSGSGKADAALQSAKIPFAVGNEDSMTISGTVAKTAFLLALMVGAGMWGWSLVQPETGSSAIPGWWFFVLIGAVVLAIVTAFKPKLAVFTGPLYALTQGVAIGAISHIYNVAFEGIVLQALLATSAVFVGMLVLFVTGAIKVTERFRGIVIGATLGIALFYLLSFVLVLFGVSLPFFSGGLGIVFSVIIVGIAALNLMLDFDMIVRGTNARAPRYFEWYGAFGLMVTIVWMYIEILRLIALTRN
ncbi:MAG: Bax inhibitor-1/YccA family protein [Acidimicrobiia bacterium]|nr:MAG: Bax inhibitor-1/YccA family protein [Acidimicrobiia bacterium]